jgi:hypothetical protein
MKSRQPETPVVSNPAKSAMPFHLPPISRRQFLAGSIATGLAALHGPHRLSADESVNPDHWALISDTHIAQDPAAVNRGVNMTNNLRRVIGEMLDLPERPAGVILSGDCALREGNLGDYARLAELLAPISQADWPVHMMMGNHDDRAHFREGFAQQIPKQPLVEDRLVSIVETRHANWFLLDSLDRVNKSPGLLGAAQRQWLADALDARPDKPAMIVGHHNPRFGNPPSNNEGLLDTDELFAVLTPRRQVKAYFFGHTHFWGLAKHEGIHLVNLPPTAYLFIPGWPNGWVDIRLNDRGAKLELHALDPKNKANGQRAELEWRA